MAESAPDFGVDRLGPATRTSPIVLSRRFGDCLADYVRDDQRLLYSIEADVGAAMPPPDRIGWLELAGPREHIYFDPPGVHAGIVTCGGLCPGLNNVIRALVMTLWHRYGVRRISGVRYGFRGLLNEGGPDVVALDPSVVRHAHHLGGTILGTSRGDGERTAELVDALQTLQLDMLFAIGGDGTQKGALALAGEIERRGLAIAVVGVPKTIDNDLSFVERSFGFETAVAEAVRAVAGAHAEAWGAHDGVGLVKLMGRESGFIAAHTVLATNEVNVVLVPEVPFALDGEHGLLRYLEQRLAQRHHAVVVVAEGAGQGLVPATGVDASGNPQLGDIGVFLARAIRDHLTQRNRTANVKYIDPSYQIRSLPAAPSDAVYCARLGAHAVHAAMTGRTACLVGLMHDRFVHVPIRVAIARRKRLDPDGLLWNDVVENTGQPPLLLDDRPDRGSR
ncbi:MAG TPA: ATP-dependent 6-phosphofructokinase [Candidatus Krumholzibacteria bacterium]|nr:ATP-dependent 6-phosphofructokinase [Candidatus Krumholzibacteria bacterium]HPD72417.1 ATP-dependent 6-phosphofructokinase [Candidatus Krumholzibacteria bacterium]HRY40651.1 ATP-dependent 6-phosphofructokinase [Candidatus Krumholzibacteria bacterium]